MRETVIEQFLVAFGQLLLQMLLSIFTCGHSRAHVVEGKTYCPDCGQGVIFKWLVLRCQGCHQRRPSRYRYRQVVPQDKCCTFCGEHEVAGHYLEDPEFYQLRYALLSLYEEEAIDTGFFTYATVAFTGFVDQALHPSSTSISPQLPVRLAS